MAVFYVDFENVGNMGIEGIETLSEDDKVIIFYSNRAENLKMANVEKMMNSEAEVSFRWIQNGYPNALDFHLITLMLCEMTEDNIYYIVSRDKGYDICIAAAKTCDRCNLNRIEAINDINLPVFPGELDIVEEWDMEMGFSDDNEDAFAEIGKLWGNVLSDRAPLPGLSGGIFNTLNLDEEGLAAYVLEHCGRQLSENEEKLVIDAVKKSKNRNNFYRYFCDNMGLDKGRALYLCIRNEFEYLRRVYVG